MRFGLRPGTAPGCVPRFGFFPGADHPGDSVIDNGQVDRLTLGNVTQFLHRGLSVARRSNAMLTTRAPVISTVPGFFQTGVAVWWLAAFWITVPWIRSGLRAPWRGCI